MFTFEHLRTVPNVQKTKEREFSRPFVYIILKFNSSLASFKVTSTF